MMFEESISCTSVFQSLLFRVVVFEIATRCSCPRPHSVEGGFDPSHDLNGVPISGPLGKTEEKDDAVYASSSEPEQILADVASQCVAYIATPWFKRVPVVFFSERDHNLEDCSDDDGASNGDAANLHAPRGHGWGIVSVVDA